MMCTNFFM